MNPSNRLAKGRSASNNVWFNYIRHAKKVGVRFRLLRKTFDAITQEPCHYCGTLPSNVRRVKRGHGEFTYSGIDRKDSSKDYIRQNVVPCCMICNRMKHRLGYQQFLRQIKRIFKWRKLR